MKIVIQPKDSTKNATVISIDDQTGLPTIPQRGDLDDYGQVMFIASCVIGGGGKATIPMQQGSTGGSGPTPHCGASGSSWAIGAFPPIRGPFESHIQMPTATLPPGAMRTGMDFVTLSLEEYHILKASHDGNTPYIDTELRFIDDGAKGTPGERIATINRRLDDLQIKLNKWEQEAGCFTAPGASLPGVEASVLNLLQRAKGTAQNLEIARKALATSNQEFNELSNVANNVLNEAGIEAGTIPKRIRSLAYARDCAVRALEQIQSITSYPKSGNVSIVEHIEQLVNKIPNGKQLFEKDMAAIIAWALQHNGNELAVARAILKGESRPIPAEWQCYVPKYQCTPSLIDIGNAKDQCADALRKRGYAYPAHTEPLSSFIAAIVKQWDAALNEVSTQRALARVQRELWALLRRDGADEPKSLLDVVQREKDERLQAHAEIEKAKQLIIDTMRKNGSVVCMPGAPLEWWVRIFTLLPQSSGSAQDIPATLRTLQIGGKVVTQKGAVLTLSTIRTNNPLLLGFTVPNYHGATFYVGMDGKVPGLDDLIVYVVGPFNPNANG